MIGVKKLYLMLILNSKFTVVKKCSWTKLYDNDKFIYYLTSLGVLCQEKLTFADQHEIINCLINNFKQKKFSILLYSVNFLNLRS